MMLKTHSLKITGKVHLFLVLTHWINGHKYSAGAGTMAKQPAWAVETLVMFLGLA